MVPMMEVPVQPSTASSRLAPSRLHVARAALELIAERDPRVVEERSEHLFTEQMRVLGPARALCPKYAQALSPDDLFAFDERTVRVTGMSEAADRVVAYIDFAGRRTGNGCTEAARAQGLVILQFRGKRIDEAWSVLRWA